MIHVTQLCDPTANALLPHIEDVGIGIEVAIARPDLTHHDRRCVEVCVAACCSVLQRVAACCSVLQCVAVAIVRPDLTHHDRRCVEVCVLQRVAACCSVLQWPLCALTSHITIDVFEDI